MIFVPFVNVLVELFDLYHTVVTIAYMYIHVLQLVMLSCSRLMR